MARIRMYFNRANDFPQVWSVDQGSHASEINVQAIHLYALPLVTGYNPDAEYPEPKAWFEVDGTLRIEDGAAVIEPTS
jgi:hypothetical protein